MIVNDDLKEWLGTVRDDDIDISNSGIKSLKMRGKFEAWKEKL